MNNAVSAHGGAMPNFDLSTLDDAWAAVKALDGGGSTSSERAAIEAALASIERLGARPGLGTVYELDDIPAARPPRDDGPVGSVEDMCAYFKRNLERAGRDASWLEAK